MLIKQERLLSNNELFFMNMRRKILTKIRSFTLIEILITTVIITVFSGLSLGGYRFFNEQKKLEEATKGFVKILEFAKKNAIVGYKSMPGIICSAGGALPNGDFRIGLTLNVWFYQFGGAYNDPYCYSAMNEGDNAIYYFGLNKNRDVIVFAINGLTTYRYGTFDFKVFGLGIKANTPTTSFAPLDANGGFSVTLKNIRTNATKTVQVDRAGTITIL